jgi:hypothetical protein
MRRGVVAALLLAIVAAAAWLGRARRSPVEDRSRATAPPGPEHVDAPPPVVPPAVPHPRASEPAAAASAPPAPSPATRADVDRLLAEGKIMEAVEAFRVVVAAEPTAQNHGDFGGLLYRLTAFDEAALHLRAAAELDPGNADRWIALANVYYRKVNPGEAWKAEKRARAAEPGLELGRDAEGMRIRKGEAAARRP